MQALGAPARCRPDRRVDATRPDDASDAGAPAAAPLVQPAVAVAPCEHREVSMTRIDTVAVVGAGFMGSGIAESVARAGLDVLVYEPNHAALDRSRERIEISVSRALAGGKLNGHDASDLFERLTFTGSLNDLSSAELVIEAIVEDGAAKSTLFAQLDAALPEETVFASNTSSIPIAELAAATSRPDRQPRTSSCSWFGLAIDYEVFILSRMRETLLVASGRLRGH
jgi:3-hydroxyacyl-CoA dehydrogenase, NAD binding domain